MLTWCLAEADAGTPVPPVDEQALCERVLGYVSEALTAQQRYAAAAMRCGNAAATDVM